MLLILNKRKCKVIEIKIANLKLESIRIKEKLTSIKELRIKFITTEVKLD